MFWVELYWCMGVILAQVLYLMEIIMRTYDDLREDIDTRGMKVGYIVAGIIVLALLLFGWWGYNYGDDSFIDSERDSIVSTVPSDLKAPDATVTTTKTD